MLCILPCLCYNGIGENMINYPNGKKTKSKLHELKKKANNKSNLGQSLENDVNASNAYYLINNLALVHKKPTPITVVNVDFPKRAAAKITEAYYQLPSTTDYNGIVRGIPIDFEAKQTKNKTRLSLSLIHSHQLKHLKSVLAHGGYSFLIIRFVFHSETYLLPYQLIDEYISGNDKKSIPYTWIRENGYLIPEKLLIPCDYLSILNILLFKGA